MARFEEHHTPAGPHEFGDSTYTLVLSDEEYEAFTEALRKAEESNASKPKLAALMATEFKWAEDEDGTNT
jgi:hypothetical protein